MKLKFSDKFNCRKNSYHSSQIKLGPVLTIHRRQKSGLVYSHLYNYCSNNPVRYTDPNGCWVLNPTDYYVLIKTEKQGFVVLAPKSFYNGEVCNRSYSIDNGKVDGVIFSNGTIFKVSDDLRLSGIPLVGNTSIAISQNDKNNSIVAYIPISPESAIPNNISSIAKLFAGRFDFSGYKQVRSLSDNGIWLDRAPTQEELKLLSKGESAMFYDAASLKEFMQQFEEKFREKVSENALPRIID